MNTHTQSILEDRVSVGRFDADFEIADDDVRELVRLATKAPSAFNLQNWHFVAVKSPEAKKKLQAVAYGQQQIVEASVTFILCGTLNSHRSLFGTLQASVDAGILPASLQRSWSDMASASHENNPQLQRDEAIRSASLAAMALLVAAKEMGYDAGAVGGFEVDGVARTFKLNQDQLPVVLIPIGRASDLNWPQKIRKPGSEILEIL